MNHFDRSSVNPVGSEDLLVQIERAESQLSMLDAIDDTPDGIFDAKIVADARHGIIYAMSQNALTKALGELWAAEHGESLVLSETTGESATATAIEHTDITPNPA